MTLIMKVFVKWWEQKPKEGDTRENEWREIRVWMGNSQFLLKRTEEKQTGSNKRNGL